MPVKHTTGRWFAPPELRTRRGSRAGGAALRGRHEPERVAARRRRRRQRAGNVFGLMPHAEHAVDELTGSTDGLRLFGSLAHHLSAVPA